MKISVLAHLNRGSDMLNDRAREILGYIERSTRERGFPPTIREIGKAFGIRSTNGVRYYLNMLEKAGEVKRQSKYSRALSSTSRRTAIPIVGKVAAGPGTVAEQSYEGELALNEMFGDTANLFALKVRGDSMVDAGILDGDYVIVRKRERASSGEIVVALLEDEDATVKYYRPYPDHVELVPANEKYEPIRVDRDRSFQILGVVGGVVRTVGR